MASDLIIRILTKDYTKQGFDEASKGVKKLDKNLEAVGRKLKYVALAALGTATLAVNEFAKFDKGVREISTLFDNLTNKELKDLGEELKVATVEFGQSMETMTKARYDIISAGFFDIAKSQEILIASSKLAVAGVADVSKTADVLTTILNAYSFSADQAMKVSDALFTVVKLGKTTIGELSSSFGTAAAIAPTLGVKLEEVGAVIATLTANGIKTDEAVTSLQATIVSMMQPSADLQKRLEALGYATSKEAINALGFAGALQKITENATDTDIAAYFPNVRAMKAVFPLVGVSAGKFKTNLDQVSESMLGVGTNAEATQKAFDKMKIDSIAFKIAQSQERLHNAMIGLGEDLVPLANAATSLITFLDELTPASQRGVVAITLATAAFLIFKGVIATLFGPMGIAITLIGVALVGAFAAIPTNAERAASAVNKYTESIKGMNVATMQSEMIKIKTEMESLDAEMAKSAEGFNDFSSILKRGFMAGAFPTSSTGSHIEDNNIKLETLRGKYEALKTAIEEVNKAQANTPAIETPVVVAEMPDFEKLLEGVVNKELETKIVTKVETDPESVKQSQVEMLAHQEEVNALLKNLRIEYLITDRQAEEEALVEKLNFIDANWRNISSLSAIYYAMEESRRQEDLAAEIEKQQKEIEEQQRKNEILQAINDEFTEQNYINEIKDFERRLESVDEFWQSRDDLVALHNLKEKEIIDSMVQAEADAFQRRSITWNVAVAGYDAFVNSIFDKELTGKQRMEKVWQATKNSFARILSDMLKDYIANQIAKSIIQKAGIAEAIAVGASTAATLSALYAAPATFASVMTFGGASVTGATALAAAVVASRALSVVPMASGGIVPEVDSGIKSGSDKTLTLLTPGELVIPKSSVGDVINNIKNSKEENSTMKTFSFNFTIHAIDAKGISDLVESTDFKKSFTRLVNNNELKFENGKAIAS